MWPFSSTASPVTNHDTQQNVNLEKTLPLQQQPPSITPIPQTQGYEPPPLLPDARAVDFFFNKDPHERLGMPPGLRFPLLISASFITGFGLGATTGGRRHADRFRAENTHRRPTTQAGWYLYHRSKNYVTVVGGVKEGVKFGTQLGMWAALFCGMEEGVDRLRGRIVGRWRGEDWEEGSKGQRDVGSTLIAGLSTTGLFCLVKRMDKFASAKMVRTSLRYSVAFGLAQDLMSTLRGQRPGYIDWMLRKVVGDQNSRVTI